MRGTRLAHIDCKHFADGSFAALVVSTQVQEDVVPDDEVSAAAHPDAGRRLPHEAGLRHAEVLHVLRADLDIGLGADM